MSLCKYKLDEFDEAMSHANRVLKLSPEHPKALYRRAQVHFRRDLFKECAADLRRILANQPGNSEARGLMKSLKEKIQLYKERSKQVSVAVVNKSEE